MGADALSKVSQVGPTNGQRRAGHNGGAIIAEEHATQNRRDVDGRSVQRQELCSLARALDPVNVLVRALVEEYLNSVSRPSRKSHRPSMFRKNTLTSSPRDAAIFTPLGSRITVKSPFFVRALWRR